MTNLRLDYIEFIAADIERSKAFYGEAFGWAFTNYPDNSSRARW